MLNKKEFKKEKKQFIDNNTFEINGEIFQVQIKTHFYSTFSPFLSHW